MIAKKYKISGGKGKSDSRLVSFDKALLDAGVGNYNLVRLSSILPARCVKTDDIDLTEGSLLPIAYATISSDVLDEKIASAVAIGFPDDESKVGVIMEYSEHGKGLNISESHAKKIVEQMVIDAFVVRGWMLKDIVSCGVEDVVCDDMTHTTFACVAEWGD